MYIPNILYYYNIELYLKEWVSGSSIALLELLVVAHVSPSLKYSLTKLAPNAF